MTHAEWLAEFRGIRLVSSNRNDAAAAARRLLRKTRRAAKAGVNDWHEAEVLAWLGVQAEEAGQSKKAVAAYLRLAGLHRQHLQQDGHALVSALEAAATIALGAGDKRTALPLAREVMRLQAEFPDVTTVTRTLVAALSEDRRVRNRRKLTSNRGARGRRRRRT